MKKIFILALAIMSLAVSGCSLNKSDSNKNSEQSKSKIEELNINQPVVNTNKNINRSINTNKAVTTTFQASTTEDGDIGRIHIEVPMTLTVDCGTEDCFQEKFSRCEKATLIASSPIGEYYYEIIGLENSKCKMLTRYNKNPNPNWVNKNMICLYDNSLNLKEANMGVLNGIMNGSIKCTGELYEILSSLN